MSDRMKLIYDCDPGTDDSVSLIMALTDPRAELLAVTAESGNFPSSISADHALRVLEYIGRTDIPVHVGMDHPLVREYPSDPYSHGQDGLGNHFFPDPVTNPQITFRPKALDLLLARFALSCAASVCKANTNLQCAVWFAPH